ncbi:DNA-binding winged helix-turn-helix (wHTH) protein [Tahibacter aquaticus]|uniref:DNA-binding winged helix-turn-helix (WHTH) protein n=1 Tax=Tahibacter aquaticus TaxID=520092 RepID=A0A4V3DLN0_9GAMM|nr:tetratricopeptide repeat protein [Tahibacter aquaticus]TDR40406.1 DNA-binding winged helix-turn-helix (wHTH) protein [Tahibacter aquaticus]
MQLLIPASWPPETPVVRVGDLCLDLRYRRLCSAEGEVELSSRVFDVLLLFLAEPNRLHTREAMLARIWSGVVVEDGNLTQTVSVLRRLLGDERKLWIRTVAKRGYVFEPPGPVVPLALDGEAAIPAAVQPATLPLPAAPRSGTRPRRAVALVAALLVVACLVGAGWLAGRSPVPPASRQIALIVLDDPGASQSSRWPATVLQSWLEWQLSLAPEVTVLNAADLAAAESARDGVEVVMLSATPSGTDRIRLQARTPGGASREAEGELASVDTLVDQVSRSVFADLLPRRAGEVRPVLRLRRDNAERYAEAVLRHRQHDWTPHLELLRQVVEQEPDFGLARLQLAQSLITFGQLRQAEQHFARLDEWAADWPADARAILTAQRLLMAQQHLAAAHAYGALAERFPSQPQFVLEQARCLLRSGYASEVIALLSTPRWQRQPVATRIFAQLNLSAAYGVMGDASNSKAAALAAQQLSAQAGWKYESAMATQAVVMADWMQGDGAELATRFDEAGQRYEAAGDPLRALVMHFYADLTDPARLPQHLPALLTAARRSGQRNVEFDALRRASFKYYRLGDFPAYRRYLEEAATLAESEAQFALPSIEFDRINEDFMRGDFASALARAEKLQQQPGKGGLGTNIEVYIGLIQLRQGRFAAAEATLERADPQGQVVDKALRREAPEIAFSLACLRGTVALLRGQSAAAQTGFSRCSNSSDPSIGYFGRLGEAEIALLGGDRSLANQPLQHVQADMNDVSSLVARWSLVLEWATQAVRHGDAAAARSQLQQIAPAIAASGYRLLELDAELGLAEANLVLDERDAARRHIDTARKLLGSDDWLGRRRLDIASAGLALARGDHGNAAAIAQTLHQTAAANGDVATELGTHDLLQRAGAASPCGPAQHLQLVTRSGMRGANLAWLLPRSSKADLAQMR